ncbi:CRISPR-associated protein [Thermosipho melanesiensis]|uniref:CRISPR-associated endoribonuclease n=2 Tax=Thermosipho melanesiensis TaxID=46541 RepID=A6LJX4_THEM4|nr:CRISPR-associated endoribonuclease Cas6 [Thermosipho melanesiensis]ABR30225.1 CRISPR-associated protein Cas6 [Thermosipho melanesiensis BI429]APT73419.1 CRISPR-associated protein [Thermosipho melanesiensis]OOC37359.1 CRISPR-associated protein [Thermosipho melanesiensis]OOC39721.1 CRISPR-associated protein [Thermosipho melanesiensis]OOC39826.1 CRISPR-associated protein [Thermosipho melanesiensis]
MRIKVGFISIEDIILPVGFNKYIQALIYNLFSNSLRRFVHEEGFRSKRKFSLFCFSSILEKGQYFKRMKVFNFGKNISFYISSPVTKLMENLVLNLLNGDKYFLGENDIYLSSVEVVYKEIAKDILKVNALTPIEVHQTYKENGRNKTKYFAPFEREFSKLINLNLKSKWEAFYKENLDRDIEIISLGNMNKSVVYYGFGDKKYVVEGWKGKFLLKGEPSVLAFAYDAGLGSKNSQGFGFIE